jgi:hypothetical protein
MNLYYFYQTIPGFSAYPAMTATYVSNERNLYYFYQTIPGFSAYPAITATYVSNERISQNITKNSFIYNSVSRYLVTKLTGKKIKILFAILILQQKRNRVIIVYTNVAEPEPQRTASFFCTDVQHG